MNKNMGKFLTDLLAFTRHIHFNDNMTLEQKYNALVSTIGHDLNGVINRDEFFSPRCSGYSKLEG